jgi:hypothetical protein
LRVAARLRVREPRERTINVNEIVHDGKAKL